MVNITSAGGFGQGNSHTFDITVEPDPNAFPRFLTTAISRRVDSRSSGPVVSAVIFLDRSYRARMGLASRRSVVQL